MDKNNQKKDTQHNSPAREFLQSEAWRNFQESVGRKTFKLEGENFSALIIEHKLPVVGKYFYIPRGPIFNFQFSIFNQDQICNDKISKQIKELIALAKNNKAGWIRIEPGDDEMLEWIKKNIDCKIQKAPHDMQPKEIFLIDITKSEEDLLSEMKPKTRYNIKVAQKRGVEVFTKYKQISNDRFQNSDQIQNPNDPVKTLRVNGASKKESEKYIDEFIRLTTVMAKRQGIVAHPESYYRKMLENIPKDVLRLYVAQYQGKVIAANLVVFYGDTCTYLHGASDDEFRNVMAPYLLQWQQILDAKKAGCECYDFGGVSAKNKKQKTKNKINSWGGITKFKLGFSPETLPTVFPGSYDVIISQKRYWLYRIIQKAKTTRYFM